MHRGCLSVLHSEYLLLVLQEADRTPTSGNPVLTELGTWSLWNTYKYVLTAVKISELLKSIYVSEISPKCKVRPNQKHGTQASSNPCWHLPSPRCTEGTSGLTQGRTPVQHDLIQDHVQCCTIDF